MIRTRTLVLGLLLAVTLLLTVDTASAAPRARFSGGGYRSYGGYHPYGGDHLGYYNHGVYNHGDWAYHHGYGYHPYGYGYGYGGYAYPVVTNTYAPTYVVGTPPVTNYQSYYPPVQVAGPQTATIELHVPANAEVWFQGQKTQQTGAFRRFVTPLLTPGSDYTYEVTVRWDENGKPKEVTREVAVKAGTQVVENFYAAK